MTQLTTNRRTYWWADRDPRVLVRQFDSGTYGQVWANNTMYQTFYRNTYIYYSNIIKPQDWDSGLVYRGRQGELIEMMIPMAKSLLQDLIGLQTKQKLNFRALAESGRSEVMDATKLCNALSKKIVHEQHLDLKWGEALLNEYLTGMGGMFVQWRTDQGKFFDYSEDGAPVYEGALSITVPTIWDLCFDMSIPNPLDWNWVQVRCIENRWDLIAQKPELEEEILALPSVRQAYGRFMQTPGSNPADDDMVYVFRAFHKKTPSMPQGRMTSYCDENTILFDGPNVYGELPYYPCRSRSIPLTSMGDPFFSMLVPAQEMLDVTMSSAATNISAFGVQSIAAPRQAGITMSQLGGMNLFNYTPQDIQGGGKPEAMQFVSNAADTYKFAEKCETYLQQLSKINGALRGTPPPGVTSGTAIATVTASALESVDSTAKASRYMLNRVMMGSINCYRRFASVPHDVEMQMGGNQASIREFMGTDLDPIKKIELQEVNPMMNTLSGRIAITEQLMANSASGAGPQIKDTKAYFAILEGAPPEELFEMEASEEDLVNRENEILSSGKPTPVVNSDDHGYHIMKHMALLNDPNFRMNGAAVQAITQHALEHYQLAQTQDPIFAALCRTGKMPEGGPNMGVMAPPPGMPPMGGGSPPGPGGPPNAGPEKGGEDPMKKPATPAKPAQDLLSRGQEVA